ncbi:MAG: hypothetical protein ABIE94_06515 [archaeon]
MLEEIVNLALPFGMGASIGSGLEVFRLKSEPGMYQKLRTKKFVALEVGACAFIASVLAALHYFSDGESLMDSIQAGALPAAGLLAGTEITRSITHFSQLFSRRITLGEYERLDALYNKAIDLAKDPFARLETIHARKYFLECVAELQKKKGVVEIVKTLDSYANMKKSAIEQECVNDLVYTQLPRLERTETSQGNIAVFNAALYTIFSNEAPSCAFVLWPDRKLEYFAFHIVFDEQKNSSHAYMEGDLVELPYDPEHSTPIPAEIVKDAFDRSILICSPKPLGKDTQDFRTSTKANIMGMGAQIHRDVYKGLTTPQGPVH